LREKGMDNDRGGEPNDKEGAREMPSRISQPGCRKKRGGGLSKKTKRVKRKRIRQEGGLDDNIAEMVERKKHGCVGTGRGGTVNETYSIGGGKNMGRVKMDLAAEGKG